MPNFLQLDELQQMQGLSNFSRRYASEQTQQLEATQEFRSLLMQSVRGTVPVQAKAVDKAIANVDLEQ